MEIAQNEVFGPVLTWQTFRRATRQSSRWRTAPTTGWRRSSSRATSRARGASRAQVVAGTVWVNCFFVRDLAAPFGGARKSGIGREGGAWSFDFFCDVKNVAIRKGSFGEEA